jgi:hypothetical protein
MLMLNKKFAVQAVAIAALAVVGSASHAALTVVTSLAAFNAGSVLQGTDTYAGLSITGSTPSPITRSAGVYGYTATAVLPGTTEPSSVFFGAGTTADPWLSTNLATDAILFNNFTGGSLPGGGITSIGGNFFGSDINGGFRLGDIIVTATDSTGATLTQTIVGAQTTSFLGFISNARITSLTVTSVSPDANGLIVWPTIDNLVLAVPEPGTYALMLAGLAAVGAIARRRKA